ncbi:MAG: hypothetical protein R2754_17670 [Microthrixaceae bacterium]
MDAIGLLPYSAAGLLLVAGASKIRRPESMAPVLTELGLRGDRGAVGIGVAEIVAGAAGLVVGGGVPWGMVAALYLAFALLVGHLWRSGATVECGCFGQRSTPVGPRQVAADLGTAVLAAVGVWRDVPGLVDAGLGVGRSAAYVVGMSAGVWALRVAHTGALR